jgi:hypothetical protein
MEKEFIPFELALKMKQLGFDEPCMYYVDEQNNSFIYNFQTHPDEFIEWCGVTVISTPLFQQAFRWFREKYQLHSTITSISQESWQWHITKPGESLGKMYQEDFYTYEEAEQDCLVKLIDIIENK